MALSERRYRRNRLSLIHICGRLRLARLCRRFLFCGPLPLLRGALLCGLLLRRVRRLFCLAAARPDEALRAIADEVLSLIHIYGIAAFEKSLCEKQAVVKAILKME